MPTRTLSVDDTGFGPVVVESSLPVLVEFWAPWCGPCRLVAPILEELAAEYSGRLRVARLNVDDGGEQASRYGVHGIPTLILFDDGVEIDRIVGVLPKPLLKVWIERALEKPSGHRRVTRRATGGRDRCPGEEE